MMHVVPEILSPEEVSRVRSGLEAGSWLDGNATSGTQSALAKRNRQLPEESALAGELGAMVLAGLARSSLFVAAALPLKVYPPLFSRYAVGDAFGAHIDTAIRIKRGSDFRVRSDLSATLFLADPSSYDGGALVIDEGPDPKHFKLPAGHMLLYPASTVHHVEPVTRGERLASFFWVQSMVRDTTARADLFTLDQAVQSIGERLGVDDDAAIRLTGVYHNLLRRWAEV